MRRIITAILMLALMPMAAFAVIDGPVNLSADSLVLDQESGLYRAQGDVQITQGELKLTADSADWNQLSGNADCRGGVRLESPDGVLTGDSISYDFTSGLGLLENGRAELASHAVFLSGEQIEKRGAISYRVIGGSFSTCAGEKPAWKLTATRLDVDVEGYARARNAVFYLKNIPVLYLPYIALPAKTERQSGLLIPTLSHSSRLGNRYIQPYYQVIDDNMDATLTVDYMSDVGIGTELEYRYLLDESRPGRLAANYITGFNEEPDRGLFQWEHDGRLPGDVRLVADVEYVNKDDYFELFRSDVDVYAVEKTQSVFYLSRNWNKSTLSAVARYTEDLQQSNATVLQYLPEVRYEYLPQRFGGSPLFVSLLAEPSYLWHRQGLKGTRIRVQPGLGTDLFVGRYLEVVPQVAWLEREYDFASTTERTGVPIASLTVGSRFARVYSTGGQAMTHVRHSIEPMLHYRYIPDVDQTDVPQFDLRDQVDAENLLTFELANRFMARLLDSDNRPHFREVASLRLAVDYDFNEARRTTGPLPDRNRPFSPVRGELILRPTAASFVRGDIAYDANRDANHVDSWAAWGGMHDRRGNGLLLNYHYSRDDFDYLSGGIDLAFMQPLYLSYEQRYDLDTSLKLEENAQLEYRGQCWSILISYQTRPGEDQVSFAFTLRGITGNDATKAYTSRLKNFY